MFDEIAFREHLLVPTQVDVSRRDVVQGFVITPGVVVNDKVADGRVALEQLMAVFGRVSLLQTDGGSEFKAECAEGMHRWADQHRIARAYKKNEQAFIEAFNGTLRREKFGALKSRVDELELAQHHADVFLDYYRHRRPHLSLDMLTPARFAESRLP